MKLYSNNRVLQWQKKEIKVLKKCQPLNTRVGLSGLGLNDRQWQRKYCVSLKNNGFKY